MARKPAPVFLERDNYRQRRMMDAVKLVAVLGAGLWMIPVLWPAPRDTPVEPVSMSDALLYIFGVWLFLIVVSAALATQLRRVEPADGEEEADE